MNLARVKADPLVRARNLDEVPLASAVGMIARERLTALDAKIAECEQKVTR